MKKKVYLISTVMLLIGMFFLGRLYGQTSSPFTITAVALPHTSCPAPVASATQFCFANDGLWQSLSGGAYAQLNVVSGPVVTSFNGQSGAVTFSSPVTSVNGKTGNVVLGATTTIQ